VREASQQAVIQESRQMTFIEETWRRLPVAARAVLTGVTAASAGTLPWAFLVSANTKHRPDLPWAVPIMAAYLLLYWRFAVRGGGWPQSTAEARRTNARANAVDGDAWGPALLAGMFGLGSILLLQGVMSRLVVLPQQRDLDISKYPVLTVLLWVVMSAVVAGVVEETSFRGYLQRPIERRCGPVVAILVSGSLFGFAHFTHPEVGLVLLPYYLAVAAVYGTLAYLTDSTFPSMILHAGGNMFSAFDFFTRGRSEWQPTTTATPLVWQTGVDAAFVGSVAALVVVGAMTVLAYVGLASATRGTRARQYGSH
jgi:membrane protease YdiL (CAAX protease family)